MNVTLHANAKTTPKVRALIQESTASVTELSRQFGVSETTIRRWKDRDQVSDRRSLRHDLGQSTSPLEEGLILELRTEVGLSLNDLVEVMKRCVNPKLSRSAIHRCLRRLGVAKRPPHESGEATPSRRFPELPCGFIHIDLKHLAPLDGQPAYVFVAIDRATRFVHIEIIVERSGEVVAQCLERFLAAFPHKVHTILTDNGGEFTDRFAIDKPGKPRGEPSGTHPFDVVCHDNKIEHRLTKPFHPQTNGMVERFNRRLAEAIRAKPAPGTNRGKNKFLTHAERNHFLLKIVADYNITRLQCLKYRTPAEVLVNLTEHNTFAGDSDFLGTKSAVLGHLVHRHNIHIASMTIPVGMKFAIDAAA